MLVRLCSVILFIIALFALLPIVCLAGGTRAIADVLEDFTEFLLKLAEEYGKSFK